MTSERGEPMSELQRWLTFSSVVFAAWCYALAGTIANALLPQMQGDLSASLDQISWVVTASVIAGAIGIPPTPWLASRFGLKPVLLVSLLTFAVSSAMVGFSTSLGEVVFWRVCQAFFGAPLMAFSMTVTLDVFPVERRGTAFAIWSVVLTTGWVFGPTIGTYFADWLSWRLSFFVITPAALIAILACAYFVPRSRDDKALRFDWMGFIALSVGLAAIQIVLNRGQREDWFESAEIIASAVIGIIGCYIYVAHTLTTQKGFISWEVFRDRNACLGLVLTAAFAFISLAPMVLVPPMLEELRGLEVFTIGLLLLPRGAIQIVANLLLGAVVTRWDPRLFLIVGFLCYAAGSCMMANYNLDIGVWDLMLPQLLQGLAVSLVWMPVFNMLYVTLPPSLRTDVATLNGLIYNIVSSAGVAILVTLLSRSLQINSEELGAHITFTNEMLRFPEYAIWDLDEMESLAAVQAEIGQQATMIGYVNVYWVLTWASLAAIPLVMFVPSRERTRAMGAPAEQRAT